MDHSRFRHQPFYCEENAWWLCADPALGPGGRSVVFIANRIGRCPFMAQRLAPDGAAMAWDYHCVVLDGDGRIWDLDSRLPLPVPAPDWLDRSFPFASALPEPVRPRFRVIPAADYRHRFASDRSHMRSADGGWQQPPPPWPPIGQGMNLPAYTDVAAPGPGEVLEIETFRARVGAAAHGRALP